MNINAVRLFCRGVYKFRCYICAKSVVIAFLWHVCYFTFLGRDSLPLILIYHKLKPVILT